MDPYADHVGDATAKAHAKHPATTADARSSGFPPSPARASPRKRPRSRGRSPTRKRPRKSSSVSPQKSESSRASSRGRSSNLGATPTRSEPSLDVSRNLTYYPFFYSKRYFQLRLTDEVLLQLLPELPINAGADLTILQSRQKFPASSAAISNMYIEVLEMRDLLWLENMAIKQLLSDSSLNQILNTNPRTRSRVRFWLNRTSKLLTSIRKYSPTTLDFTRLTLFRFDAYPPFHPMHLIQDYIHPIRSCIPIFKLSKDPLPFIELESVVNISNPDSDVDSMESDSASDYDWDMICEETL